MLLMPNRKKVATIIVQGLKPKADFIQELGTENGTGEYKMPENEGSSMGLEAAMDDFLRAMDRKDAGGMARAFKNAMLLCDEAEPGEEA